MPTPVQFVQDAVTELRQVRWPTRQQAIRLSIVVISFTIVCTIILGAVDLGLSTLLQQVLNFAA